MTVVEFNHYSVMLHETIEQLNIRPDGIYVDGTLGGGGHAYEVCSRLQNGHFYGIDQDDAAIAAASERLRCFGDKVTVIRNNYVNAVEALREYGVTGVDGIVLSGGFVSKAPMAVMRGLIPIYTMSYYSPLWLRYFIRWCGPWMIRQYPFEECYFLEDAKKFREALQLPLIYVGGLVSREGIERALDSGFELVQMARALVNDPAFVNKLREGDAATRSECDHRNYCIARMYSVDMKCCKHCGDLPRKIREELAKLP